MILGGEFGALVSLLAVGLLELVNSKSGHRTEGSAGSMGSILLFECETCQQNGFQDRYFVSKNFHKKTASMIPIVDNVFGNFPKYSNPLNVKPKTCSLPTEFVKPLGGQLF